MGDIILGTRLTGTIEQSQRVIDMSDVIAQLQPSASPLTTLLMKLQKKTCNSPKFEWLEDNLQARWDKINKVGGYVAGDLILVVDNVSYFTVRDIVKVARTGECMLVGTVTTGDSTITVTRGYGTTAAAAINDDDWLVVLGNANPENATAPGLKTVKVDAKSNYTQIFRTPFGTSRTTQNSKLYGGQDLPYQRKKKGIEHVVDIERAMWFGEPKETLATGLRTTAGIFNFVTTNVLDAGGALNQTKLEEWCRLIFKYGSDVKFAFCSPVVLSAISSLAVGKLQLVPKDQTFGLSITRFISPHGELNLIKHRLLENQYDGYAVALDLKNLWYRPLANSDTKLKTNIQANDADGETDEYITECGLQLELQLTHGILYGVTG